MALCAFINDLSVNVFTCTKQISNERGHCLSLLLLLFAAFLLAAPLSPCGGQDEMVCIHYAETSALNILIDCDCTNECVQIAQRTTMYITHALTLSDGRPFRLFVDVVEQITPHAVTHADAKCWQCFGLAVGVQGEDLLRKRVMKTWQSINKQQYILIGRTKPQAMFHLWHMLAWHAPDRQDRRSSCR